MSGAVGQAVPVSSDISGLADAATGYDITLVTADGQESKLQCSAGTTVLAAAERAGLVLADGAVVVSWDEYVQQRTEEQP